MHHGSHAAHAVAGDARVAEERERKILIAIASKAAIALREHPITNARDGIRATEIVIKMERVIADAARDRTPTIVKPPQRDVGNMMEAAVGLHYATYKLMRRHTTLKVTPAMALRVASEPWSIADRVTLSEGDVGQRRRGRPRGARAPIC